MTLKERVVLFLKYKNLSQAKFEKQAQLPNGFVNNIGVGINTQSLIKILETFPELNATWLLIEVGDMLLKEKSGTPPDYINVLIRIKDIENIRISLDLLNQALEGLPPLDALREKQEQQLPLHKKKNRNHAEGNPNSG